MTNLRPCNANRVPYWLRGALRTGLARRPIEATHPVNLLRLQLVRERLEYSRHVSLLVWLGEPGGVARFA